MDEPSFVGCFDFFVSGHHFVQSQTMHWKSSFFSSEQYLIHLQLFSLLLQGLLPCFHNLSIYSVNTLELTMTNLQNMLFARSATAYISLKTVTSIPMGET